jgi:uncharacterized membrane protein YkgB
MTLETKMTTQKMHDEQTPHTTQTQSTHGEVLMKVGLYGVYAALAIIYFWFGGMKFTTYEATNLVPLVNHSPLLGWVYEIFSPMLFSQLLGFLEISIGLLIAGRLISPKLAVLGGLLSAGLFITTLSFMFSTPGVIVPEVGFPAISVAPGQFLLKDLGLLAVSLFIAGHSLVAIEAVTKRSRPLCQL